MEPIEQKALNFLVELTRIISNMQMYNDVHPIVKSGVEKAHATLTEILRMQPVLNFGKGEDVLLIQNKQITEKNPSANRFVQMLAERNIGGVVIRQGVTLAEVEQFIKLMSTKRDSVLVNGAINPDLLAGLNKISVNEIKYLMVGEDEDLESLTEARKFFNNVFTEEFKGLKGTEALSKLGMIIQKIMPKLSEMHFDNEQEELWDFFEKSLTMFGGNGIQETKQGLLTSVKSMPPDVQKKMFGQVIRSPQQLEVVLKKFSDDKKAEIIAQEAANNKDMSNALNTLLKTKGEIVKVVETLMKKFGSDVDQSEEFTKIYQMIQQVEGGAKLQKPRGTIWIAEPDEERAKEYEDLFFMLNFKIRQIPDGAELLEEARKLHEKSRDEGCPDLILMELKLPNRSGIEILGIFDIERIRIPIIICTTLVNEEKSFEVQMYYKQKFLVKDEKLPVRELMEAADEFCPREKDDDIDLSLEDDDVAEPELSEEMKAELNKAKEIQRNLMPKQFPAMPGYELQAFYQPYDQVGGDYYDVIPIDNDHVGILVADVSGHGISGAMVMVMVRSAIHMYANSTTSPRALLEKVNPLITRDILPGLFVTVYYAVLNMPQRILTCSCAGHNPAIFWDYQTKQSRYTQKGGMPLGILSGPAFTATLKEEVIPMKRGDRIILYTDGMVETMDPNGDEFSEERFMVEVNRSAGQHSSVCVKHLVTSVIRFQDTAPQHDDLTLITLRSI